MVKQNFNPNLAYIIGLSIFLWEVWATFSFKRTTDFASIL